MGNQFGLTADPEDAILIDLAARRIVHWVEPPTIKVYLVVVHCGYPASDAGEPFLIDNSSLLSSWYKLSVAKVMVCWNDLQWDYQEPLFCWEIRKPCCTCHGDIDDRWLSCPIRQLLTLCTATDGSLPFCLSRPHLWLLLQSGAVV